MYPSDTTFLFINSLGTDFRIWNEVAESLKRYGNIVLFDNRGHGLSSIVEGTATVDDFADDAEALLKHLSIKKCIPVGLSVGGMIAQVLAVRAPSKFPKLILCDTRHKIGNAQIWNERIAAVNEKGTCLYLRRRYATVVLQVVSRGASGKSSGLQKHAGTDTANRLYTNLCCDSRWRFN